MRLDQSQWRARQVAEQAHIVWLAIGVVDRVHGLPVERVDEAGTEVVAAVAGDVGQGAVLGVQHGGRFQGVGDFQHKLLAGGGAQLEILVALAGQRGRRAVNAKQPPRQIDGIGFAETRCMLHKGHWIAPGECGTQIGKVSNRSPQGWSTEKMSFSDLSFVSEYVFIMCL